MARQADARGKLFVIAAPSGAGKTSLVRALMQRRPALRFSISYTTRKQRPNEQRRARLFLRRQAEVRAHDRGAASSSSTRAYSTTTTARRAQQVEQLLDDGENVLLEIDWQGAQQIRRALPECRIDLHAAAVARSAGAAAARPQARTATR